jgi:transcriptional regulator with XRE-family HTH domain
VKYSMRVKDPDRFRARAVLRGLTQAELARSAGIGDSMLTQMLAGRKGCTPDTAGRVADVLGAPVGDLFIAHAKGPWPIRKPSPSTPTEQATT